MSWRVNNESFFLDAGILEDEVGSERAGLPWVAGSCSVVHDMVLQMLSSLVVRESKVPYLVNGPLMPRLDQASFVPWRGTIW